MSINESFYGRGNDSIKSNELVARALPLSPRFSCFYLLISTLIIFFLFSFKFSIISVGEGSIRLDDILFIPTLFLVLYSMIYYGAKINKFYLVYVLFCIYCLISTAIASFSERVGLLYSSLFVLRLIQYSIFYFFGQILAQRHFPFGKVLKYYTFFLALVIPFQYFGLIPIPGDFGTERASGNTNGPYELAAVSAFLLFYFLNNLRVNWFYCLLSFLILFLTSSRTTIAAVLFVLVVSAFRKSNFGFRLLLVSSIILIFTIILSFGLSFSHNRSESDIGINVINRYSEINISDLTNFIVESYHVTNIYKSSADYIDGAYIEAIANISITANYIDASGATRFSRWASLTKSALATIETVFFGLGPSFGSIAIDGYFVRLFTETGLLGCAIFSYFVYLTYHWTKLNATWLTNYLIVLCLTAIFIDIFMSYKPMMLLWLGLGFSQKKLVNPVKIV